MRLPLAASTTCQPVCGNGPATSNLALCPIVGHDHFFFPEICMEVHHILLLAWVIVFAFWLPKQFAEYNKRTDRK
jgi:hypothetical protein